MAMTIPEPTLEEVRELLVILYADDDPEDMANNIIRDGWRKR